jgi:hypothetical protein
MNPSTTPSSVTDADDKPFKVLDSHKMLPASGPNSVSPGEWLMVKADKVLLAAASVEVAHV